MAKKKAGSAKSAVKGGAAPLRRLPDVERVKVDPKKLARYAHERDFTRVAFELMREVASYTCIAACVLGSAPAWDRDHAVVGGNMVRLYKLLSSLLDQTTRDRRETSTIVARLAFETAVNLRYLIANFSPALIESYIRYSLRHERKLQDLIRANIAERNGREQPIETRMLKSLKRTADVAGIQLDAIDLRSKAPWGGKNIQQKAAALGWADPYEAVFAGMSHNVHGSWQDIYDYHLHADGHDHFTPNLDWHPMRPQFLLALGFLVLRAAGDFVGFIGSEKVASGFNKRVADLAKRIRLVDNAHETYLVDRWRPIPDAPTRLGAAQTRKRKAPPERG